MRTDTSDGIAMLTANGEYDWAGPYEPAAKALAVGSTRAVAHALTLAMYPEAAQPTPKKAGHAEGYYVSLTDDGSASATRRGHARGAMDAHTSTTQRSTTSRRRPRS
eukprot:13662608-Heterocapsa_arctica.AAC.1